MQEVSEIILGDLDQKPLVEVIGQIYASRQTGEMQLQVKKSEYKIFFFNGIPVFAQSSLASDNILEFMVHLGQMDREDVPRLQAMIKQGLETDQAILETGITDTTKLYYLKMLLAREIIIRACGQRDGSYKFELKEDFLDSIPLYDLSPMEIIYEAINRHQGLSLADKMQKMAKAQIRLNPDLDELQSLPEIYYDRTYLLDEFQEEMPLEKAIMLVSTELKDLNHALLFLYVMIVTGVLLVIDEKPTPKKPEPKAEPAARPRPRQVQRIYPAPPAEKKAEAKKEAAPVEAEKKIAGTTDYIYGRKNEAGRSREKIAEAKIDWKQESLKEAKKQARGKAGLEQSRKLELLESKIRSSEDYFQVLGIKPDTPVSEVEKLYAQMVEQFELEELMRSPDPELSKRGTEARDALVRMINILNNPEDRSQYENSIYKNELKRAWSMELRVLLARKQFERGKWYLEHNRPEIALEKFEQAIELNPEVSDYYAYTGWAIYRARGLTADADGYLQHALKMSARSDLPDYFMGLIAKREKNDGWAEECLKKALSKNPNNQSARRELDSIEKHKKAGFFDKLFSKK